MQPSLVKYFKREFEIFDKATIEEFDLSHILGRIKEYQKFSSTFAKYPGKFPNWI